jgi:hypothetical protein
MSLETIAEAKCSDPMNTWPQHNNYHRRNTHPFSGTRHGELYWDEECLRCQLEKALEKQVGKK